MQNFSALFPTSVVFNFCVMHRLDCTGKGHFLTMYSRKLFTQWHVSLMFQMKMFFFAVPVRRNSEENCKTGTKKWLWPFLSTHRFCFPCRTQFSLTWFACTRSFLCETVKKGVKRKWTSWNILLKNRHYCTVLIFKMGKKGFQGFK